MSKETTGCGFIPPGYAPCTRDAGHDGPCAHPFADTTQGGRTSRDAIHEAERLLSETFGQLDPDNGRDAWFLTRLTKVREALADRPA